MDEVWNERQGCAVTEWYRECGVFVLNQIYSKYVSSIKQMRMERHLPLSERWDIVVRLEDIPSAKTNTTAVYKDDEGYIRARKKANVLQMLRERVTDVHKSKLGGGDLAAILGGQGHFLFKPVESSGTYMQFVKRRK